MGCVCVDSKNLKNFDCFTLILIFNVQRYIYPATFEVVLLQVFTLIKTFSTIKVEAKVSEKQFFFRKTVFNDFERDVSFVRFAITN